MERRKDQATAERIDIALLTRNAFDEAAAVSYAMLSGVAARLVEDVFSRPIGRLRRQVALFVNGPDRRAWPRV
ncbi:MAG: hypothetical protein V4723_02200 [Pseudomonadota bacterium]